MRKATKTFHASIDHLYEMLDFVQSFAFTQGFDSLIADKIKLATEEALVNIIRYGFPNQEKPHELGDIEICCEELIAKPGLKILIKDRGIPFDPMQQITHIKKKHKKFHHQPIEDRPLGGYGILIYVGLMDRVEYYRTEEGNLLFLVKYL